VIRATYAAGHADADCATPGAAKSPGQVDRALDSGPLLGPEARQHGARLVVTEPGVRSTAAEVASSWSAVS